MLNNGFHLCSSKVTRSIIESNIPCYYGVLIDTDYGKSKINVALSEYDELINKHFADDVEVEIAKTFPIK